MCGYFSRCFAVSYILRAPNNLHGLQVKLLSSDTGAFPQRAWMFFVTVCNAICERVTVTNKAITFRFTRDRRSLTLVFSVRYSWVVSDEKQVILTHRLAFMRDWTCILILTASV